MLQKEFEDRTSVKVSFQEYQSIDECYMKSDLDKDEFCKTWCKMNSTRVKKAKEEARAKEEERKQKEALLEIIYIIDDKMREFRDDFTKAPLTVDFLSDREQKLLDVVGIELRMTYKQAIEYGYPYLRFYRIDETSYDIKKYLKLFF